MAAIEDIDHVWKCQGTKANLIWDKSILELRNWLRKEKTQTNLADIICDRLSAWRYDRFPTVNVSNLEGLLNALSLQDLVGWNAFFEGVLAKGWKEVQHASCTLNKSKK